MFSTDLITLLVRTSIIEREKLYSLATNARVLSALIATADGTTPVGMVAITLLELVLTTETEASLALVTNTRLPSGLTASEFGNPSPPMLDNMLPEASRIVSAPAVASRM